jgi:hypothetical protein
MKRGPTEYRVGGMNGGLSRAFNPVEADPKFAKLRDIREDLVRKVDLRIAQKYLAYYRKRLKPFNTKRHVITIAAAMGATSLRVNGKEVIYPDRYDFRPGELTYLLAELDQALTWEWACYLDGERIN